MSAIEEKPADGGDESLDLIEKKLTEVDPQIFDGIQEPKKQ